MAIQYINQINPDLMSPDIESGDSSIHQDWVLSKDNNQTTNDIHDSQRDLPKHEGTFNQLMSPC